MMTTDELLAIPSTEIVQRYKAEPAATSLAKQTPDGQQLLQALIEAEHFVGSVDFLAHWLPKPHGIWWGCLCLWNVEREAETAELNTTLQMIIHWLQTGDDEQRQALSRVKQWFPSQHPANLLAKAALCCGGSLSDSPLSPVPPPEYLPAVLVSATVKLLASRGGPLQYLPRNQQFLQIGQEILCGANLWYLEQPTG